MKKLILIALTLTLLAPVAHARSPYRKLDKNPQEKLHCDFSKWVGKNVYHMMPEIKSTAEEQQRAFRVTHQEGPITQSYVPNRITVTFDDNDVITGVSCE